MDSLHRLAEVREDLEEIRDNIKAILEKDELRVIDWDLEDILKMVNLMLELRQGKPNRRKIRRIRDWVEALREYMDDLREEITNIKEDLKEMLEADSI
jgi:cell division protein ZapA (FtsZ GTPase activity inhibitor)